jgi:hydroxyacylglutathione hydrolase
MTEIYNIPFGRSNGYILKTDEKISIIDAGLSGQCRKIERTLASLGLDCTDIDLVLLTHTHYDHTGCAAECRRISGASLLVHEAEAENLRVGRSGLPAGATGLGRFVVGVARRFGFAEADFEAVEPDIVLGAADTDRFDLHKYGFPGIACHTPSHSHGSLSFITDDGDCFPGDILFNIFPGTVTPPFADNPELLTTHWRLLLSMGAQTFYPGHGKPFGREKVKAQLRKRGDTI